MILLLEAVINTLIPSRSLRKDMESAADDLASPKTPKLALLPDIWSVVSYATKDRKRGCGCEALTLKVHRIYKKIDPNYQDRMHNTFYSCCGLCCSCHSDAVSEAQPELDFNHHHPALLSPNFQGYPGYEQ